MLSAFTIGEGLYPQTIDWDTHFKGEPEVNSPYTAVSNTIWQYGYKAKIKGKHLHLDFNFTGGIDASTSWVNHEKIKNRKVSKLLLNHEQGHVNINFLLLRNGETILRNQAYTIRNYKSLINSTAKDMSKFYSDMQVRYDVETKHGTDLDAQRKWDGFFEQELQ